MLLLLIGLSVFWFLAGTFLGLVLGAMMARADLRADREAVEHLRTELDAYRPSAPQGSELVASAPAHSEGR